MPKGVSQKMIDFATYWVMYKDKSNRVAQAAIDAGYSPRSAHQIGGENLQKPIIQKIIADITKESREKNKITIERVMKEYACLAFSNAKNLYNPDGTLKNIHELPDDVTTTIGSVEVTEVDVGDKKIGTTKKVRCWDKVKSLDSLSKILGMAKEETEKAKMIQNNTQINIQVINEAEDLANKAIADINRKINENSDINSTDV